MTEPSLRTVSAAPNCELAWNDAMLKVSFGRSGSVSFARTPGAVTLRIVCSLVL